MDTNCGIIIDYNVAPLVVAVALSTNCSYNLEPHHITLIVWVPIPNTVITGTHHPQFWNKLNFEQVSTKKASTYLQTGALPEQWCWFSSLLLVFDGWFYSSINQALVIVDKTMFKLWALCLSVKQKKRKSIDILICLKQVSTRRSQISSLTVGGKEKERASPPISKSSTATPPPEN